MESLTFMPGSEARKLTRLDAHSQNILDRFKAVISDMEGLVKYGIETDAQGDQHIRGIRIVPDAALKIVYARHQNPHNATHEDSPFMRIDIVGNDFQTVLRSMQYSPVPHDAKPFFQKDGMDLEHYNASAKPQDKLIESVPLARAGQYVKSAVEQELLRRASAYFPLNLHGVIVCNLRQGANGAEIHSIEISPNMAGARLKDAVLSQVSDRVRFHGNATGLNREQVEGLPPGGRQPPSP